MVSTQFCFVLTTAIIPKRDQTNEIARGSNNRAEILIWSHNHHMRNAYALNHRLPPIQRSFLPLFSFCFDFNQCIFRSFDSYCHLLWLKLRCTDEICRLLFRKTAKWYFITESKLKEQFHCMLKKTFFHCFFRSIDDRLAIFVTSIKFGYTLTPLMQEVRSFVQSIVFGWKVSKRPIQFHSTHQNG